MKLSLALIIFIQILGPSLAGGRESPKNIQLPKPQTDGGKPLMRVLHERKSSRSFSPDKLPLQTLSNLLWAAFGINRPDGHRTAPSAKNWQEIDIYVVTPEGAFSYQPKTHSLVQVLSQDIRSQTGKQSYVKDAPLALVYISDLSRMTDASADDKLFYSAADTGFIAQNVYLFCSSTGLATVIRGSIDRPALAKLLKLRPDQRITLAQTVGLPKK